MAELCQKKLNRSISNNFEFSSDYLQVLPEVETIVNKNVSNSDSKLAKYKNFKSISSGSLSDDLDIASCGKTSSSSISWCDEFETQSTQLVQNEFERMERILQGNEKIPSDYNKDEYELWIKTFPQLSVAGRTITLSKNQQPPHETGEIIVDNKLLNAYYEAPNTNKLQDLDMFKNSVIDEVLDQVSSRLLKNKKQKIVNDMGTLTNELSGILRISPVLLGETTSRSYYLDTRQQSTNSVRQSEQNSSKWMKEKKNEYSSLPYLSNATPKKSSYLNKTTASGKSRSTYKLQENELNFLPPIKIGLSTPNTFRSISATPRKSTKGFSALSMQSNLLAPSKQNSNYLEQSNNILLRRKNIKKL